VKTAEEIEREHRAEVESEHIDWDAIRTHLASQGPFTNSVPTWFVEMLLAMRDELVRRDAVPTEADIAQAAEHLDFMDIPFGGMAFENESDFADRTVKRLEYQMPKDIDALRYARAKRIVIQRERERLAAARTPVDRECSICGKVAPHRPDEGLCIACADELVRCNERLEAREAARTPEVVGEIGETE
jgi:hypothetical protein